MKTAEEWVNSIEDTRFELVDVIERIQQDALKQGYIDACLQMSLECEKMKGMKQ